MKKMIINVTAQAKAVRKICTQYTDYIANKRYKELFEEISTNPTISQLVCMIGESIIKEEQELEHTIESALLGRESNVYFDDYRYVLSNSREMITTLIRLMGW